MNDEANFQKRLLDELALLFDPVIRAALDPDVANELLRRFGWSPEGLFTASANTFTSNLAPIGQAVGTIVQAAQNPPQSIGDLETALDSVATAVSKVGDLQSAVAAGQPQTVADALGELAQDLVELLTLTYIARRAPVAIDVLRLLTIVHTESRPRLVSGTTVVRRAVEIQRLDLGRALELIQDPIGTLRNHYLPNGLKTDADVLAAVQNLYPAVAWLLHATGATVTVGRGSNVEELDPAIEALMTRSMAFEWRLRDTIPQLAFGSTARLIPENDHGPGVVLSPFGEAELDFTVDSWQLTNKLSAEVQAIVVTGKGIEVLPAAGGGPPVKVETSVRLDRLKGQEPALRLGSATGTRLEIGAFAVEAMGAFANGEVDIGAAIELGTGALVISAGDGDGFIAKILPPDGIRADFELGVAWSRKRGLRFTGGATIDLTLPIHAALGPLSIDAVHISIGITASGVPLELSVTANAQLGPLSASAERVGLKATLTFPESGGNLGPVALALAFKPPSGVGLAIDAGPVSGGGYLYVDPDRGQYAGVAELSFQAFSFKAIGILTTKMPDGSLGFSLLLIITADFPPIQLGYGFTLNGLGGLLGINRTSNVDALRAGLKRGGLNSIMFPQDPVLNAPQLISDLQAFFPVAPGRFLFGPMVAIGWGTPSILRIELGVVLDLPSPLRLIVMGRLLCALPFEDEAVVNLRLDVLGILDFDRKEASVDASLIDSRVATFPISGDMAMRLSFGAKPTFALAAGGLNPHFQPPDNFPQLQRLAIALATGDNPRVRLEAYLALTANTAQTGARLELYAAKDLGIIGNFSIEGHLGFDALFQFVPFYMRIDLFAGIALKRNGRNLFAVDLSATLEGPGPWHIFGEASFEFLCARRSFPFDKTFGQAPPPTTVDAVDPLGELKTAFAQPGNWTAALPTGASPMVSLRQVDTEQLLVHPLGAALTVRQRVLPLAVPLETFGTAPLAGLKRFEIERVRIAGATMQDAGAVRDHFAPAQFFQLTEDQKLSRPSFEELDAGRSLKAAGASVTAGPVADTNFGYETIIVDEVRRPAPAHTLTAAALRRLAHLGAAGRAELRHAGTAAYAGPQKTVDVQDTQYVAVRSEDLRPVGAAASQVEALAQADEIAASKESELIGHVIVVAAHEVGP